MNEIVKHFRGQFPDDPRSDDAITLYYADQYGVEKLSSYGGFMEDYNRIQKNIQRSTRSIPSELGRGIASGVDQVQAKLYDTARLAGDIFDSKKIAEFGEEGYRENLREAAKNTPTIPTVGEVEGVGDAARYGLGLVGSQIPQLASTLSGAAVGAAVGGVPGAIALGGLAGATQMQNYGELRESGVSKENAMAPAMGVGALGAALELLVPFKVVNKFLKGASDDVAKEFLARALREIPLNAVEEGGTEIAQELVTMAGEMYANRDNPNFKLKPEDVRDRLINAGAAGALVGGLTGPISAIPGNRNVDPIREQADSYIKPQGDEEPPPQEASEYDQQMATARATALRSLVADDYETDPLSDQERDQEPEKGGEALERTEEKGREEVLDPAADDTALLQDVIRDEADRAALREVIATERARLTAENVEAAAAGTDANPTEAQKEAENYKQGKATVQGLKVSIENAKGTIRSKSDKDGKLLFAVTMPSHYGKILKTEGADGDHVDVYLGPDPELPNVFVVDQRNAETGVFDEHKTMIGFPTMESAIQAYDAAFSDGKGPLRRQAVTETTIDGFKEWLDKGDQTKPFAVESVTPTAEAANLPANIQPNAAVEPFNVEPFLDSIDWDGSALSAIRTKHGKKALADEVEVESPVVEERTIEPSFFTVTDSEFSPELAERLVSDAKGTAATKSQTRRITFFEDQDTGEVIGVPTWYTSDTARGGKIYRVANPAGGKGVQLKTLMEEGRFVPVASVRLANEVSGTEGSNQWRFEDFRDFETRFLGPAQQRLKATAAYSLAMPAKMRAQGFDENGDILETYSPEDSRDEDPAEVFQAAIVEELSKTRDLTLDGIKSAVVRAGSKPENLSGFIFAMRELLKVPAVQERVRLMDQTQAQTALTEELARVIYERVEAGRIAGESPIDAGSLESVTGGGLLYSKPESEDVREKIKEGAYVPERLPPGAGASEYGSLIAPAEAISRRSHGAVRPDQAREYSNAGTVGQRRAGRITVNKLVRPLEEAALREWAKKNKLILDNREFNRRWKEQGERGETEHEVYLDVESGRWWKRNNLSYHGNWMEYFQRLALHNWLFPSAAVRFEGFVENDGQFQPVISQADVEAVRGATRAEVASRMAQMGFQPVGGGARADDYINHELGVEITDLHDENVLVGPGGQIFIIDPIPMMVEESKIQRLLKHADDVYSVSSNKVGRATKGQFKARFASVVQSAIDAGVTVDVVKALGREVGSFSGKDRKITLALFDAENPSADNLRLVLHEVGHDVVRGLDPRVSDAVHAAIEAYSDEALGLQASPDPRIQQNNPAGLPAKVLSEERLAEHLALRGLDQPTAAGVAGQIVRFVKALYYRLGLALQKVMGRPISQELAMAYVRNRFEQAVSDDPIYRFFIPKVTAATLSTDLKLSLGDTRIGERLDPRVIVETKIAALNEQVALNGVIGDELVRVPGAAEAAKAAKKTVIDWWRHIIGLPDPAVLIEGERQRIDPATGLVIASDPGRKISDFEAPQNQQIAAREAYIAISKQWVKVQRFIDDTTLDVEKLEKKREREAKKLADLEDEKVLPMSDADTAKRKKAIRKRRAEVQALAKKRDRLAKQVEAAQWVVGIYRGKVNEIAGVNQIHKPFYFGHDAEYIVPEKSANGAVQFTPRKIKISATGELSDRAKLLEDTERMGEWLMDQGTPRDGRYFQVKRMQEEILRHGQIAFDLRQTDFTVTGLKVASMADQAKSFGTPIFRTLAQMINQFTGQVKFLRPQLESMALEVERAKHAAANLIGVPQEYYLHNFYRFTANFLESRRDIVEAFPKSLDRQLDEAFRILRQKFTGDSSKATLLKDQEDKFMAALRRHVEAEWKVSRFLQEHNSAQGIYVKDDGVNGERGYINVGVLTLPVTVSQGFHTTVALMADSNWAAAGKMFSEVAEAYNGNGPDGARQLVGSLFANPEITERFFRSLVYEMTTFSPFPAPMLEDGVTQPEANPAFAREAFDACEGDPITFFELLYDLHEGTTDKGQYVQQGLQVMGRYFGEMRRMEESMNPEGMKLPKDLKTMIPGFMVHARQIEHWPSSWREHISFDSGSINRITERVAAQVAFGTNQERLVKTYNAALDEHRTLLRKLRNAEAKVAETSTSKKAKEREDVLAREVGGPEELKRLRKARELHGLIEGNGSIRNQMVDYFTGKYSPIKTARFMQQLTGTFAGLMINQPGSALSQMAETFTPFIVFGASPQAIRMSTRNLGATAKELAGGLVQALGISLKRSDRDYQRAMELGVGDSEASRRIRDILNEPEFAGESRAARLLRQARQTQNLSVGSGDYTAFRPAAPFQQTAIALHLAGTVNFWKEVQSQVLDGVEWVQNNAGEVPGNLSVNDWAGKLDYSGLRRDGFVKMFQRSLDDWGLDYGQLVKEAQRNIEAGRDVLSDETLTRLQGMWVKESSSESNISTMATPAFTNSVLRFMLPLLGWGWRRGLQVASLRYDETGKAGYTAMAKGLAGLALLGGGGLAVSLLVDIYNEEILKKRRNLRRLSLDQDAGSLAYAILEHSARVGTFGLLGDAVNTLVNVGTGEGANRGVSLDQRVVFVNSTLGMMRAVSAFINQDFEADYMNVIRPAMFSVGGNGALQYMQVANGILGLDNFEARANNRTNVHNWLRVVGREVGLEVRNGQGGYGTPTPMTPHITRMQLAALANEAADFMAAYREALSQAREEGKDDPADFVEKSFASRHPLRSFFRSTPSELDYTRILNALPEDGRGDVRDAVNLFNRFGSMIGVNPFDGKEVKTKPALLPTITREEQMANVRRATLLGI